MIYYDKDGVQIICDDCVYAMKKMHPNSIDLTVTSPPYDSLRTYHSIKWDEHKWRDTIQQLYNITKYGGVVVWIVNDMMVDGGETGVSFRQALWAQECGFKIHDTMIWHKISAFQHPNRYIASFEYMFVLSKGPRKTANLICDRPNKWAGTQIHGTERKPSGDIRPLSDVQKSKVVKNFGARFNVWDIPAEKNNKSGHPAPFPYRIAHDHIVTWSEPGDIVLDPFCGSGTTLLAAKSLDRAAIGIEISAEYCQIAKDRVEKWEQTTT